MTTRSFFPVNAALVLALSITAHQAKAQAAKPTGLRANTAAKSPAKDTTKAKSTKDSLAPSKATIDATPKPVVLPPKQTIGLTDTDKRRINTVMTRQQKAEAAAKQAKSAPPKPAKPPTP